MRRTVITKFYCKVRTANGTTDLQSNEGGDLCELVGSTDNGRQIWRWTGPAVSEPQPVEIIFTNHDLLTDIMAFDNGGYYNYASHLYNAGQTTGVPVIDNGQLTMMLAQRGGSTFVDAGSLASRLKRACISITAKNR